MGFISSLTGSKSFTKDAASQSRWRQTFQITSKEDSHSPGYRSGPEGTGVNPRNYLTNVGTPAQVAQLLRALRSLAPGGWTDNRMEQTAHWTGIAYVAGHRICEQLYQSEFQVLERNPDNPKEEREVSCNHDLVKLLEKPNGYDGFGDMLYRIGQQLLLTGTALMWEVPNKWGTPVELYTIPTALAIPQSTITPEYPQGYYRVQPVYPYGPFSTYPTPLSAAGALIPAQWMIRIQFPHPLLRYEGYSPLTALRLHLDEVESIDRSRWYMQRRGINPSAVLEFDAEMGAEPLPEPEILRIKSDFESDHQGPENAGRLIVSTPGAEVKPWGATPDKMMYESGWEQLTEFCIAGLGITKEAAGMIGQSSYSNLFATLKQFHVLTLEPLCARIAQNLTRRLASSFGDNLIIKIRAPRIDDHDLENSRLNSLVSARAITKNELRKAFDFEPTQEDWGNEIAGDNAQLTLPQQAAPPAGAAPPGGNAAQGNLENGPPGGGEMTAEQGNGEPPPPPPMERETAPSSENEIANTQPKPGKLGLGSLGPTKHLGNGRLNGMLTKSHPVNQQSIQQPIVINNYLEPQHIITKAAAPVVNNIMKQPKVRSAEKKIYKDKLTGERSIVHELYHYDDDKKSGS